MVYVFFFCLPAVDRVLSLLGGDPVIFSVYFLSTIPARLWHSSAYHYSSTELEQSCCARCVVISPNLEFGAVWPTSLLCIRCRSRGRHACMHVCVHIYGESTKLWIGRLDDVRVYVYYHGEELKRRYEPGIGCQGTVVYYSSIRYCCCCINIISTNLMGSPKCNRRRDRCQPIDRSMHLPGTRGGNSLRGFYARSSRRV